MGATGASNLAAKKCVPCKGGTPPLVGQALQKFSSQFPDWKVIDSHHITKAFKFGDFKAALDFVNRVGAIAEEEFHHPDIMLAWGRAEITTYTHKINGLSENDFILAAKIDQAFSAK